MESKISPKAVSEKLINAIKNKGKKPSRIRSVQGNRTRPRSLKFKWHKKTFTPDIVAFYPDKRDLFSIEPKINKKNIPELVSKWILMAIEARRHGGKFYLVAPPKHEDFCNELIEDKKLRIELISPGKLFFLGNTLRKFQ